MKISIWGFRDENPEMRSQRDGGLRNGVYTWDVWEIGVQKMEHRVMQILEVQGCSLTNLRVAVTRQGN